MKIGIVGAGVSGIGAGRLLSQAGFDCEIFEQGSQVGGIWTEGYHTFGLQTPKSLYEVDFPAFIRHLLILKNTLLQT